MMLAGRVSSISEPMAEKALLTRFDMSLDEKPERRMLSVT